MASSVATSSCQPPFCPASGDRLRSTDASRELVRARLLNALAGRGIPPRLDALGCAEQVATACCSDRRSFSVTLFCSNEAADSSFKSRLETLASSHGPKLSDHTCCTVDSRPERTSLLACCDGRGGSNGWLGNDGWLASSASSWLTSSTAVVILRRRRHEPPSPHTSTGIWMSTSSSRLVAQLGGYSNSSERRTPPRGTGALWIQLYAGGKQRKIETQNCVCKPFFSARDTVLLCAMARWWWCPV